VYRAYTTNDGSIVFITFSKKTTNECFACLTQTVRHERLQFEATNAHVVLRSVRSKQSHFICTSLQQMHCTIGSVHCRIHVATPANNGTRNNFGEVIYTYVYQAA